MLIIIDLNFVLKGCFLCPVLFLFYISKKFYFKAQIRIRMHPWMTMFLFLLGKHYLYLRQGKEQRRCQAITFLFFI